MNDPITEKHEIISHDEAEVIALRFINQHFDNAGERPRASIPANPKRDDDLRLMAYIRQQKWRNSPPASEGVEDGLATNLEEAIEFVRSLPVGSMGEGHDSRGETWPLRDELADSLCRIRAAILEATAALTRELDLRTAERDVAQVTIESRDGEIAELKAARNRDVVVQDRLTAERDAALADKERLAIAWRNLGVLLGFAPDEKKFQHKVIERIKECIAAKEKAEGEVENAWAIARGECTARLAAESKLEKAVEEELEACAERGVLQIGYDPAKGKDVGHLSIRRDGKPLSKKQIAELFEILPQPSRANTPPFPGAVKVNPEVAGKMLDELENRIDANTPHLHPLERAAWEEARRIGGTFSATPAIDRLIEAEKGTPAK